MDETPEIEQARDGYEPPMRCRKGCACTCHANGADCAVCTVTRLDVVELRRVVAVAKDHGWNGTDNSKILSVFLDQAMLNADVVAEIGTHAAHMEIEQFRAWFNRRFGSQNAASLKLTTALNECWDVLTPLDADDREMVLAVLRGRNAPALESLPDLFSSEADHND